MKHFFFGTPLFVTQTNFTISQMFFTLWYDYNYLFGKLFYYFPVKLGTLECKKPQINVMGKNQFATDSIFFQKPFSITLVI